MSCSWSASDITHSIGGSRGRIRRTAPPRVQILSLRYTKFSKRNCLRSPCPPYEVDAPPTGNPGSATDTQWKFSAWCCFHRTVQNYFPLWRYLIGRFRTAAGKTLKWNLILVHDAIQCSLQNNTNGEILFSFIEYNDIARKTFIDMFLYVRDVFLEEHNGSSVASH